MVAMKKASTTRLRSGLKYGFDLPVWFRRFCNIHTFLHSCFMVSCSFSNIRRVKGVIMIFQFEQILHLACLPCNEVFKFAVTRQAHQIKTDEYKFCQAFCLLHRRNPTAVRYRCAQRCDSENEHSIATAVEVTLLR